MRCPKELSLGLVMLVVGCSSTDGEDTGADAPHPTSLDAVTPRDATDPLDSPAVDAVAELDAAPDFSSLVCTGRPIPEGLTCVVQDPAAAGPCDGAGGVVFDGSQCVLARAGDCTGELGAFASLEECGVTCAAAGHCNILNLAICPEWQAPPQYCGDTPYECPGMGVQRYDRLAPTCAVWGPFSQALVRSEDVPFPGHWDLLYSLSLVRDTLGLVICDPL